MWLWLLVACNDKGREEVEEPIENPVEIPSWRDVSSDVAGFLEQSSLPAIGGARIQVDQVTELGVGGLRSTGSDVGWKPVTNGIWARVLRQ